MKEKLVQLLKENQASYISGERLSEHLQCSRTAIWKHIQQLKEQGYEFEASPRRGYKLIYYPDSFNIDEMMEARKGHVMGHRVHYVEVTESTQQVALDLYKKGASEGTVAIAEQQTKGKARQGKAWYSPPGKGLWFSLILQPKVQIQYLPQLTLLLCVALCRTLRDHLKLDIDVKWPNDLLWQGKKISGILVESAVENEHVKYAIAGIGMSVNLLNSEFPVELQDKAISIREALGREVDRQQLLLAFLVEFEHLYKIYHEEGFGMIRTLWEAFNVTLGNDVTVHTLQGVITGKALEIDSLGALVIQLKDGTKMKIYSGDVQTEAKKNN